MFIRETFDCIEDFIDTILDSDYVDNIAIVCKHGHARRVIKELLNGSDILPLSIELEDEEWAGYDREFIISVKESDLYCEKLYRDDCYINTGEDIIFILPGCNGECRKHIANMLDKGQFGFEISFICNGVDEEETKSAGKASEDGEETSVITDGSGNIVGFSKENVTNLDGGGTITSRISVITPAQESLKHLAEAFGITLV